jgi:hypothetical protein
MVINIKQATTFEAKFYPRKWVCETTTLKHCMSNTFSIIGYNHTIHVDLSPNHVDLVLIYVRIIFKMIDLYEFHPIINYLLEYFQIELYIHTPQLLLKCCRAFYTFIEIRHFNNCNCHHNGNRNH